MIAMETRPAPTAITTTGMTAEQWPQVEVIYRAGIATGYATFEAEPPSWDDFDRTRLADHRLVANDSTGRILGWVAATPVSDRYVYAGVVEHSVYVAPDAQGRGIRRVLLDALATSTEQAGTWTIQSGSFPRTWPASPSTNGPVTASSAPAAASA